MAASLILGVDPGSRKTGFAALARQGRSLRVVDSGVISLPAAQALSERLGKLLAELEGVLARVAPTVVAVEDVFSHRNARSALALGQARGVVLAGAGRLGVPVHAYPPAAVKRALAGHGRADKGQIQRMVQVLLSLERRPGPDEADAMAVAVCHALSSRAGPGPRGRQ